ncbi:hypothetical protein A3860_35425 [Niastella vici]|uniref:Secretion system C-terminal sorting domain-containing protein n=1 Tax=Niastella vici TaxID=1703345 RepID=A0A1V9FNQ1_9BACT|nr:hypothetical protein [Niastella vici]OQP59937.1 hypothetical protein A3860_35425 [Niastella vici]
MRKIILLCLCAAVGVAGVSLYQLKARHHYEDSYDGKDHNEDDDDERTEGKEEDEDGIWEAQQQEIEKTKDVSLGYVPKYRLVNAYNELMRKRSRQMQTTGRLTTASSLTWIERGPNTDATGPSNGNTRAGNGATSGRMRAIWVDIADTNHKTVWVGGIDGGVWKTNDITASPASWSLVNDFFGNLAIASICQDPSNPNIMYFGTGEKAFNADAVRGGGVWKSTDHGVTWSVLPATTNFWNVSKVICDTLGNVYVATIGSGAGIQRSADGGNTWTNITPSGLSARVTEMKLSSTGRMHIVCGYYNTAASIAGYRFTDNPATVTSATWTAPTTSFTPVQYNCEITCSGNTLYVLNANAAFQTPQIYKSVDGGANWSPTTTSPPAASGTNDLSSGQGWYNLAIGADPANPNNVIAGGLNCYRSTDGGATWSRISAWVGTTGNYVHADQHIVAWAGNQVLVGSDGGIFYSANGGTTFSDRNVGLRLKQFYSCAIHPGTTNYFLAGAQDNGCHQLTSPGLGGSIEITGGDGAFVHIDQDQPQYQFGSYVYSQYRRSTNGGSTWSSVNYSSTVGRFINPTDYDDLNNKMYTAGNAGQYVRWENPQTGSTFTPVTVAALASGLVTHVSVSPYTPNRIFLGTGSTKILQVDNANAASPVATDITGSSMSAASTVSCVAMGTNDSNLIATFSNYGSAHVWVTTTGGGSSGWSNISGNLPDIPVRWAMFYPDDNTQAIIATDMGVYETDLINGSATVWTQDANFPVVRTDMLQFRRSDRTLAAATHGRGLWTTTIPATAPFVRFAYPYTTQQEATSATAGCRGYTDYTVNMTIDMPATGDATATVTVAAGGSAKQGIDFDFTANGSFTSPSNKITFATDSSTAQHITIRVYDDGNIESTESFTLNYTIAGHTNALVPPGSTSYTFFIADNDAAPLMPGAVRTATIGAGDLSGGYIQPFRSSFQKAKSQYIYLASELTAMGFKAGNISSLGFNVLTKTSTLPDSNLTISLKNTTSTNLGSLVFETGATVCYSQTYSTVQGMNTFTFNTPFYWDGTSNLLVEICYDNGTAFSGSGDYVSTNVTTDVMGIWNRTSTGVGCSLDAAYNSVSGFYIRPDIILTGIQAGVTIETTVNTGSTNYLAPDNSIYYYSTNGKLMARLTSLNGFDFGCTSVAIDRAGLGATPFWSDSAANRLMNKTFYITPSSTDTSGQYQLTLYYSADEKAAWEAAMHQSWDSIQLVKANVPINQVTPADPSVAGKVTVVTPVHGSYGNDYTLSYTFSGGAAGFGAGIPGVSPLKLLLLDFEGKLYSDNVLLHWKTSVQPNLDYFEVQKSENGVDFTKLGRVNAFRRNASVCSYYFTDRHADDVNYYRLKIVRTDSSYILSDKVLILNPNNHQKVWVLNNPFHSYIDVRFAKQPQSNVQFELVDLRGVTVFRKQYGSSNLIRIDLSGIRLFPGIYLLRTFADGRLYVNKVLKL